MARRMTCGPLLNCGSFKHGSFKTLDMHGFRSVEDVTSKGEKNDMWPAARRWQF